MNFFYDEKSPSSPMDAGEYFNGEVPVTPRIPTIYDVDPSVDPMVQNLWESQAFSFKLGTPVPDRSPERFPDESVEELVNSGVDFIEMSDGGRSSFNEGFRV